MDEKMKKLEQDIKGKEKLMGVLKDKNRGLKRKIKA